MQIPQFLFTGLLWAAIAGVSVAVVYLVIVLLREWRRGDLW